MDSLSPILLFVYNRPLHTQQAVEALKNNDIAKQTELFIYSDAAKNETDYDNVAKVREYIRNITGFANITITERCENYGLARNIIDGVTEIINRYGKVIVLEDDLIVAPYFLQFMNDALDTYKDEPKIGHIQAYDFTNDPALPDTFLIKFTGSWGWGTWSRAWKHFNPDGKALLKELEERKLTHTFDFNGNYKFTRMLRRQTEGRNNSWAIRWNASLFLAGILSLNTGKSLVQNNGFDGSGTNCGGGGLYQSNLYTDRLDVVKITDIRENATARQAFTKYYRRTNSFMAKAIRRIKRTLKGDFGA
ncbi:glycosyltransferase [Xylanibacter muris]|uniref:Glycosyltransferase n=1 Tax=Xylanibacter muris TaxID=2736290 RepID=A0ABX2AJ46_9BACT|nr:glycosyltransferase [Xylanibacter muris]NPD91118.1 glycosyltransferase [Xylanibacter muris]